MRVTGAHRGNACYPLNPLAVQAVPIAANYMPSVLFFNVVSVPQIGTAGFEPATHPWLSPLLSALPLSYVPKWVVHPKIAKQPYSLHAITPLQIGNGFTLLSCEKFTTLLVFHF